MFLSVSCGDAPGLLSLAAALHRAYPDTQVGVTPTDGLILTVTMTDSPPADSPRAVAPCPVWAELQ
jgi:hypothetical protein